MLCTADLGLVMPKLRCDILGQVLCRFKAVSDFQGKREISPMILLCTCFDFSTPLVWYQVLNRTIYCVDVPSEKVLGSVAPVWFGVDFFLLGYKTYCVCHRYKSIKDQFSVSLHNLPL